MTCQDLVERVTEYLDGVLPAAVRADFDAHVASCPDCDVYLEQMRTTIRLAHDTPRPCGVTPG